MIFTNETPFSALLLDTVLDDTRKMASTVVRVTYVMVEERLEVSPEQPWIVSREPWESPVGKMEEDLPFMKGGVDLFVFGEAVSRGGRAVEQMAVEVKVGEFVRRASVSGDREWVRRDGKLTASRPVPFVRMPLTLEHSFGGKVTWDGLTVPWADNPAGKGFCIDEASAEGVALPNFEELDSVTRAWSDRPVTCGFGFCPRANSARFKNGFVLDADYELREMRPHFFNAAYPPMIAPAARAGDRVKVGGVSAAGSLRFTLPAAPCGLHLQFGSRVEDRALFVDQIGVDAASGRVFITYRFPFRFTIRPGEPRRATLTMHPR